MAMTLRIVADIEGAEAALAVVDPLDELGDAVSAFEIESDAATAFGTGEHPSTAGVLLALDRLAKQRRFHRPLDIGTGSGILAIAATKRLHRPVLASDIDAEAVRVAQHHAARNGV